MTDILINQTVGRSSAEIDAILISAAATTWSGAKTISAAGNNSAHTSESNSSITTLNNKGVSVTVN